MLIRSIPENHQLLEAKRAISAKLVNWALKLRPLS